jgi:hypothetical protein
MIQTLDVVAANGVPFRVLFIPPGVAGPNPHRTPADSPHATVEFYDRRYEHTEGYGQFTGGHYFASSLLEQHRFAGLNLQGGVDAWTIDAATMDLVRTWLALNTARFGGEYTPVKFNLSLG